MIRKIALVAAAALALALAGCNLGSDNANQKDVTGVNWQKPDKIEVFANIDEHPNVVVLCIHKVAWVTTTRVNVPIVRVPEYDVPVCGGVESKWAPRVGVTPVG